MGLDARKIPRGDAHTEGAPAAGVGGKRTRTEGLQRPRGSRAPTGTEGAGGDVEPALYDELVPGADGGPPDATRELVEVALAEAAALEQSLATDTTDRAELAPRAFHLRTLIQWLEPAAATKPMLVERLALWDALAHQALVRADVSERRTGVAVVDEGKACDRDREQEGCFLSTQARQDQFLVLSHRIGAAFSSVTVAVERVRQQEIAATAGEWGFIAEILFSTLGGIVASALVKGVARKVGAFRAARAESPEQAVSAVVASAGVESTADKAVGHGLRALRNEVKGAVTSTDPDEAPLQFLAAWHLAQRDLARNAVEVWPSQLNDEEMTSLVDAFSAERHTPDVYEAQLRADLARFKHQVNDLGQYPGHTHSGWVTIDGQRRLALLESEQGRNLRYRGDMFATDTGRYQFVHWIDDDLADYAAAREATRGAVPELGAEQLLNPDKARSLIAGGAP